MKAVLYELYILPAEYDLIFRLMEPVRVNGWFPSGPCFRFRQDCVVTNEELMMISLLNQRIREKVMGNQDDDAYIRGFCKYNQTVGHFIPVLKDGKLFVEVVHISKRRAFM